MQQSLHVRFGDPTRTDDRDPQTFVTHFGLSLGKNKAKNEKKIIVLY
jgi:hypothetical protein